MNEEENLIENEKTDYKINDTFYGNVLILFINVIHVLMKPNEQDVKITITL